MHRFLLRRATTHHDARRSVSSASSAFNQILLDQLDSKVRVNSNGDTEVKHCKLCDKPNKSKPDNCWKLLVRPNGSYYCYRCQVGGNYNDLQEKLKSPYRLSSTNLTSSDFSPKELPTALPDQEDSFRFTKELFPVDKRTDRAEQAFGYLTQTRGLSQTVLMRYGVGVSSQSFPNDSDGWEDTICITFPWMNPSTDGGKVEIQRIKYRALLKKGCQRLLPKGGRWGFFGWQLVRPTHDALIITEGEYDCLAVAQALSCLPEKHPLQDLPVVSLPNGCNSLPVELIEQLSRFKKIYLWMDNDKSGQDAAVKFANKLGSHRCWLVRPDLAKQNPPKDANDALRWVSGEGHAVASHVDPAAQCGEILAPASIEGVNLIIDMLTKATQPGHDRIETFQDLRHEVLSSIYGVSKNRFSGTLTPSLPKLTNLCKGFRRGELAIFTGPTGGGKTTLLSQISLDFAKQGVPTFWGSFEIKNVRLLNKMLHQYSPFGGLKHLEAHEINKIADEFSALPLSFMNFHSSTALDEVLDAMEFAVYRNDIQHIVLDNLQFMLPRSQRSGGGSNNFEKFDMQDAAIDAMRKFATDKNVNILLVVHPRKEDDRMDLLVSSIFGSAKVTQEADMVFIMQRRSEDGCIRLDVKKNRFDGELGSDFLRFDANKQCYFEVLPPPPSPSSSSNMARNPSSYNTTAAVRV